MGGFAQQTSGPATNTGANTNIGALIQDRANNIVETVGAGGLAQALASLLTALGPQTALTAITTAQNLFTYPLGAQVLNKLNRIIVVRGTLIYTSPGTTAPVVSLAVKIGTVVLCTITLPALSVTASANMPVQFEFTLQTTLTGTAGMIEAHGMALANISANTPAAAAGLYLDTNTAASAAVNLNIAETLAVTVASTLAVSSVQIRQASIQVVN